MRRPVAPLGILVVEDEALLAMDMEAMVDDSGHRLLAGAASLDDVEALADALAPDLAFVDLHLAHGTSGLDACRRIRERWKNVIVVFVTANPRKLPADCGGGHGVIPKPFSRAGLMAAMRYIEQGVCNPPPAAEPPASFIASPRFAATWA
jgi:CheY-like chemotaxis protein